MLSQTQNRDYSWMSFLDLCDTIDELKESVDIANERIEELEWIVESRE